MKNIDTKGFFYRMLEVLLVIVLAVVIYKAFSSIGVLADAFKRFMRTFSPFFYGFLLAYVLNIPSNGVRRLLYRTKIPFLQKHRKGLSIGIVYLLLVLLVFFVLRKVIPTVYESIMLFVRDFDRYYQRAEELLEKLNSTSPLNLDLNIENLLPAVENFNIDSLFSSFNAIIGVSSSVFRSFLVLISSVYILIEKEKFKAFLRRILKAFTPAAVYSVIFRYTGQLNLNFKQYIYAQTLDGCILGTLAGIELALLGSQYALVLGIMLGFVNYIPYFGSIIGTLVAVMVVMFSQSIPVGLFAMLILLITQQIDGNIIQPKLMSSSFSISPLLVIISVTVGGAVAGVIGMLAAIPTTVTLLNILEDITVHFEKRKV